MFRSDKGSQSNKGRSPYLIGQKPLFDRSDQGKSFTQSDKANLSQIRATQVWPRLRYGLVEYVSRDCGSLLVGHHSERGTLCL